MNILLHEHITKKIEIFIFQNKNMNILYLILSVYLPTSARVRPVG